VGAFVRKSIETAQLATYHAGSIRGDSRDFSRITPTSVTIFSTGDRVFRRQRAMHGNDASARRDNRRVNKEGHTPTTRSCQRELQSNRTSRLAGIESCSPTSPRDRASSTPSRRRRCGAPRSMNHARHRDVYRNSEAFCPSRVAWARTFRTRLHRGLRPIVEAVATMAPGSATTAHEA